MLNEIRKKEKVKKFEKKIEKIFAEKIIIIIEVGCL